MFVPVGAHPYAGGEMYVLSLFFLERGRGIGNQGRSLLCVVCLALLCDDFFNEVISGYHQQTRSISLTHIRTKKRKTKKILLERVKTQTFGAKKSIGNAWFMCPPFFAQPKKKNQEIDISTLFHKFKHKINKSVEKIYILDHQLSLFFSLLQLEKNRRMRACNLFFL